VIAGPGDNAATARSRVTRSRGDGRFRVSRGDREQVIELLKTAFVDDRLTKEELDLRVAQALASRTRADLAAVTADMPKASTAKKSTAKVRTARVRAAGVGVTGAVAVAVTVVLVLVTSIPQAGFLGGRCRRRASRSISPSSAPSWWWTTCTPAPLGSGYGKITNIVQPRLSLRSLITARADGRIRLGTGLGESGGAREQDHFRNARGRLRPHRGMQQSRSGA